MPATFLSQCKRISIPICPLRLPAPLQHAPACPQLDKRTISVTEGITSSSTNHKRYQEQQVTLVNTSDRTLHFTVAGPDPEGHASPLLTSSLPAWLEVVPVRGVVPPGGQVAIKVGTTCCCMCCCWLL
jgi:hypothetical protein